MRLDMISRRRFLKSAGVAALAVAAAGVLAGCDGGDSSSKVPGTEVPDVPGTTSKQVKIIFADVDNGGAGIGNGGDYYEPHVVKQIQNENGNVIETKNPVLVKRTISQETSTMVKDYMRGVVENGSGKKANLEGYEVGGKTGTAEKLPRDNGKYLVSFIGYAPQENPQVMVYVVIDEPNSAVQANSGYATQLASQIMTDIFPYLGIEKKTDSASNTDTQTTQTAQQ